MRGECRGSPRIPWIHYDPRVKGVCIRHSSTYEAEVRKSQLAMKYDTRNDYGSNRIGALQYAHKSPTCTSTRLSSLGGKHTYFPFPAVLFYSSVACELIACTFVTCHRVEHIDQVPDMLDYRIRMCST